MAYIYPYFEPSPETSQVTGDNYQNFILYAHRPHFLKQKTLSLSEGRRCFIARKKQVVLATLMKGNSPRQKTSMSQCSALIIPPSLLSRCLLLGWGSIITTKVAIMFHGFFFLLILYSFPIPSDNGSEEGKKIEKNIFTLYLLCT